jgi:hypothetical protein
LAFIGERQFVYTDGDNDALMTASHKSQWNAGEDNSTVWHLLLMVCVSPKYEGIVAMEKIVC